MASRLPVRLLARHCCNRTTRRNFSSSTSRFEAHNFTMPAMSPTMTEGNISSWKVKEGDSFSTGDILLEIETDKASMDVEAQDDGVMAKIFVEDGSKAVKVGTRIAVLADPGDDLASLKIPEDTSEPVSKPAENVSKAAEEQKTDYPQVKGTPENKRPDRDRPKTSLKGSGQNPSYPLYPSVMALIHQNHIPEDEVMKIPATGPQNRLLKGDVLAYLGSIDAEYSKKQSERIDHNSHLDLSNIKIPEQAPKPAAAQASSVAPEIPLETSVSLPISLAEVLKVQKRIQDTLGVSMPLSTFLARAVDYANEDLPLPKGAKPSSDDLFNAVLGLNTIPRTSRGTYLPQIDALPVIDPLLKQAARPKLTVAKQPDIFDILSGKAKPITSATRLSAVRSMVGGPKLSTSAGAINVFSVTVPAGEEKRARVFLERMKTVLQIEPGKLVL